MEGGDFVFIDDLANQAQVTVSAQLIGDAADLMTGNLMCRVAFFNERPIDVTLPTYVQLEVTKKVTVETGAVFDVPLFVRVGDTIKIDTRTHECVDSVERLHQ